MEPSILVGDLIKRVKKYDTEEERQESKIRAVKKYAAKRYYCEICDKTMTLHNYSRHIESDKHFQNSIANK